MSQGLPESFINELLAKSAERKTRSKRALDFTKSSSRDIMVWTTLNHLFTSCANEQCPDQRVQKVEEGKAMCAEISDGVWVCRLCYLSGYGLDSRERTV